MITYDDMPIIFAAVGQTLFVVVYMTFPWYQTFLGKALFFGAATLSLLLDTIVIRRVMELPTSDGWILALYWLMGLGVWAQLIAFAVQRFTCQDHQSTAQKREYHHGT